jgi:hypothetical protein
MQEPLNSTTGSPGGPHVVTRSQLSVNPKGSLMVSSGRVFTPRPQLPEGSDGYIPIHDTLLPRPDLYPTPDGRQGPLATSPPEAELSGRTTTTRHVQRPIYIISEVLHNAKTGYPETQKLLYTILLRLSSCAITFKHTISQW